MAAETFKNLLYNYLSTTVVITGQVGTRIYPELAPTSAAFPYATYSIISDEHQSHLGAGSPLTKTTVQIDVWAPTYALADTAAEGFRKGLHGYQGETWGTGATKVEISSIRLVAQRDDHESPTDGSQKGIYRVSMDFTIWHDELVPTFA